VVNLNKKGSIMLLKMEVRLAVIFSYWTGRHSIWVWHTRCSSLL